ncbi:hypothetical protein COM00_16250 [Bacillus toyonensis]|nr:hypothetical protein CN581_21615 [Bacillus toyonensis]PGB60251.1 hypothetical protein COM00_16250 [Bacillus toyonensis]
MERNTSHFGKHEAAHSNHTNKGVLELSVKVIINERLQIK